MPTQLKQNLILITYTSAWFFVNLLTLITYPIMHSDESWLAGLTQTMMDQSQLLITEPFFDLAPRAPHTFKLLYHLIQWPFIQLFGYQLFSVRLMSLVLGFITLGILYRYFNQFDQASFIAFFALLILSMNSQFVYAAHFARQEIALLLVLILCLYLFNQHTQVTHRTTLIMSTIIGLSMNLHPNAFIIAMMIGSLYLAHWLKKKISYKVLLSYIGPMALLAVINLIVTFTQTKGFINTYWQYARTLSVGATPTSRLSNFIDFYIKVYQRISGTYYLPDIKYLLIISIATLLMIGIVKLIGLRFSTNMSQYIVLDTKKTLPLWQCFYMILAYNIAIFIIGRYNPTSILFLVVILVIVLLHVTQLLVAKSMQLLLLTILLIVSVNGLYKDYNDSANHDYDDYVQFLQNNTDSKDVLLANLSGGFAMNAGQFYDIRNLNYLGETSLEDYIVVNKINVIIYYEEYDYIHRNPEWQILYGDDQAYYAPMKELISDYGTLRVETTSLYYGNRIIRYMGDYPWSIKIYDLDLSPID